MNRRAALGCLAVATAVLAGCGSDRPNRGAGSLDVVATVGPVADIAHNAGSQRVTVTTLVPVGADPHEWRPGPAELAKLRDADVVVRAGGELDRWAAGVGDGRELELLPRVNPLGDDSHWWQDPVRVQRAAKEIRNEFARADVEGAGFYEAATADYLERLRRLDREIRICLSLLERRDTVLAAQHDGFAYFNDRYGTRIVGPGGAAELGRRLWADTLAPPGTPAGSYLGAMAVNTGTLVDALSDGGETCLPVP